MILLLILNSAQSLNVNSFGIMTSSLNHNEAWEERLHRSRYAGMNGPVVHLFSTCILRGKKKTHILENQHSHP
jgi:hypothetical protein